MPLPLVAIEPDLYTRAAGPYARVARAYADRVAEAGGFPVIVPPRPESIPDIVARCDALVLTGGDDPRTEPFGAPTDPRTTPILPERQAFAARLLEALRADTPARPVLGICLGMQLMALDAGGSLAQHMPESHPDTHADHWERDHDIHPEPGVSGAIAAGTVHSKHRQCVDSPGTLRVTARAHDGVIEAVDDPARAFYVGVQWHPERTSHTPLGQHLFDRLIAAAR